MLKLIADESFLSDNTVGPIYKASGCLKNTVLINYKKWDSQIVLDYFWFFFVFFYWINPEDCILIEGHKNDPKYFKILLKFWKKAVSMSNQN